MACSLLVALGLARISVLHLVTEGGWKLPWRPARTIDERWEDIRAALPPSTPLGYVSTDVVANPREDWRYLQANYALAPRVLVRDAPTPYIVADLPRPGDLDVLCERQGLVKVLALDSGVALLKRRSQP